KRRGDRPRSDAAGTGRHCGRARMRAMSSGARSININSVVEDPFGGVGAQHEDAIEARLLGQFAGFDLEGRAGLAIPAADGAMHHALVALGFRELPRNADGAVGGEAMMGTLKAALRAPALGTKGLINWPYRLVNKAPSNPRPLRRVRRDRHGGRRRAGAVARAAEMIGGDFAAARNPGTNGAAIGI